MREIRAPGCLLAHPHIARIEGEVVSVVPAQNPTTMPPRFTTSMTRERLLARMLEHDIDVALAVICQIAVPNGALPWSTRCIRACDLASSPST